MFQRQAIKEFHCNEGLTFVLSDFINGANIGMVKSGGCLCLTLKAGKRLWVFGHVIWQELKGHKPVELDVLGLVNHTHPASAQLLDNSVMGNGSPKHRGRNSALG